MNSPFIMVIFGATGDLAKTKLIPSLLSLYKKNLLPQDFFIVGFARRDLQDSGFRNMFSSLVIDSAWKDFSLHLYYQQGSFENENAYYDLIERLRQIDEQMKACVTRLFYLATPPVNYEDILSNLQKTKLSEGCGSSLVKTSEGKQGMPWTKIIVEKPFGKDLETARNLDKKLSQIFQEQQIFRVDHYLGKETVQNLLVFRFANNIFEPIWNNQHIDHVQITWGEKKGIEGRGAFFDGVGLLRDVAQNHLMQLIAAVAMEQPKSFNREDVRDARVNAIKAIHCIDPSDVSKFVVRGQYEGYKEEKDVALNSETETFLAMKVFVDSPRFLDVPFYLRAGKKLAENVVEISIVFRQTCHVLFKEIGCPEEGNILTFRIQPDEGIGLHVIAKKPGTKLNLDSVDLKFSYHEGFGGKGIDAYEKLLVDIFEGDQMLFNRSDELESSWDFITKILEGWKKDTSKVALYKPGTWGSQKSLDLIQEDGKMWLS